MKVRGLLAAMIVSFGAQLLPAQPSSCSINALVTVLDKKSHVPIDGLTAADFRAKVEGRDLSISVSPAPQSRRFVFVVDRSGSMTSAIADLGAGKYDPTDRAKQILEDSISAVTKNDSLAFLVFAGDSSAHTGFAQPGSVAGKVNALLNWRPPAKVTLRTPLWDSLHAAVEVLGPPQNGDVIVVVSDGRDNASKLRTSDVRKELLNARVTVLAMIPVDPYAAMPIENVGRAFLEEIAKVTGGAANVLGTPTEGLNSDIVSVRPAELIRQLSHQYTIEVDNPNLHGLEKWKIEVTSSAPGGPKQLFYPRYLSPCAAMQKTSE